MRHVVVAYAAALGLLVCCFAPWAQTLKRNRDEGTADIRASNVMGNGNITAFLTGGSSYSLNGFTLAPSIGGSVGITDIMELYGQIVPVSSKGMGPVEAHLQITTPGNDNLRFFGIALIADLFLSTARDTLSQTAATDKPEYNSYPMASITADLDWIAWKKWLPLKTYMKFSMADNPDVLYRYDQIALLSAIEWKLVRHSLFCEIGTAMYKEKPTKTSPGDNSYAQRYAWIEPGARYRLFSMLSLVGSTKLALYQQLKETNPLKPELFNVSLRLEAPIFFRETNSEAIRTLIFMEQKKERKSEAIVNAETMTNEKNILSGISASGTDEDSLGSFDFSKERQDLIRRREETQKKMADIENLFADLNREDSLKTAQKPDMAPPAKIQPDSSVAK